MPPKLILTVVILTKDEARHIERCVASLEQIDCRIVVVDSGSTDATRALAQAAGAEVYGHAWINYATQFNWALENCAIDTPWTMRLDADEIVLPELARALEPFLAATTAMGVTFNRRIYFLGRWLRWGGIYPTRQLRVWRTGRGRCEDRWMDEHIIVDGAVEHLNRDFSDINLNNLEWWTEKHNNYATRLAIDELLDRPDSASGAAIGSGARIRRWVKDRVYSRLPYGSRAVGLFVYRYVFRLGFLDGEQGTKFHLLQGLWYRFLVDVKIKEIRKLMAERGHSLQQVVEVEYGYRIAPSHVLAEAS